MVTGEVFKVPSNIILHNAKELARERSLNSSTGLTLAFLKEAKGPI